MIKEHFLITFVSLNYCRTEDDKSQKWTSIREPQTQRAISLSRNIYCNIVIEGTVVARSCVNKIVQFPPVSVFWTRALLLMSAIRCAHHFLGGNLAVSWYGRSPNSVMKILLLVLLYDCAHIYHHLIQGLINVVWLDYLRLWKCTPALKHWIGLSMQASRQFLT